MSSTDLRAANDILNFMERSKAGADELFDSLPGFLLVLNSDGLVLRANRVVSRETGFSSDDVPGTHLGDLLGKNFWIDFGSQFDRLRVGNELRAEFECPMKTDTGARKMMWWQITAFQHMGKRLPLFFAIGNDITELRRHHEQVASMEKDLEVTRTVQELLLPDGGDIRHDGLRFVAHYQPVAQSGGDWWWCSQRPDGISELVIGDVTGHGIASAMVAASICGGYGTARESVGAMASNRPTLLQMSDLFSILERSLERMRDYWMTLSAFEIDTKQNELRWLAAGAPPVFIHRVDGTIERLTCETGPLAASGTSGTKWTSLPRVTSFSKGDRAMIFTDGLYEFRRGDGEEFGVRRLEKLFRDSVEQGPLERSRLHIQATLEKESLGEMLDDGMFVLVERT